MHFLNLFTKSRKVPLLVIVLAVVVVGVVGVGFYKSTNIQNSSDTKDSSVSSPNGKSNEQEVLGRNTILPQIYIYGGDQSFSSGGMIALASTDEPAVQIGGYNITGAAEIGVYEASIDTLIDYLTHDSEGKQTKKIDITSTRFVATVKHAIDTSTYRGSRVVLPLKETGIWYLRVKIGNTSADAFVIRSNTGILTEEGDNEFIFWGQNFRTKRSITEGNITILDLQDRKNELYVSSFNSEGIARAPISVNADIALFQSGDDRALVPINLKYLNTNYRYDQFQPKGKLTRYFIFTDRPLYKPGDLVYFKAVLRDDDDARYTISGGEATAKIYNEYYYDGSNVQPIFEQTYPVSPDGTIYGQYRLPEDAKVGYHTLYVSVPNQKTSSTYWDSEWTSNSISFDVQYYRKPEFSIDIETSKAEFIAGEKASFTISGEYFSGQPLINQKVKYNVYSGDYYEYQYFSDTKAYNNLSDSYRYGAYYGGKVTEGSVTLDEYGKATVSLDTKVNFNAGKSQVFSVEATIEDGSQNPSFARRNLLVHSGEYGVYRKDSAYGAKVSTPLSLPIIVVSNKQGVSVDNITLNAKIHRENWISYQEEDKKYPSYRKEEEDLSSITARTDRAGNAVFTFTPKKIGSYTITVDGKDAQGNSISKVFYSYVHDDDYPYYSPSGNNDISISTDKLKYNPTDIVKLNIFSSIPNRDVFLSFERGRVNRFQIVRLNGKNGTVDVPLVDTDVPNIYAKVASFSNYALDSMSVNVPVSSDGKKLLVSVVSNSKKYGPGENVTVDVKTTDVNGNPVSADVALWTVDKAIFELSDNRLGDIFTTFWKERSNTTQEAHSLEGILVNQAEGGGCFAAGTKVLMANGSYKNIEDVRIGDFVMTRTEKSTDLVKAKVSGTHTTQEGGYLILNGNLKITANHILWVNGEWKEAGSIEKGDTLSNVSGGDIEVRSIEWQQGKFDVYNLEIEKYHTYFAGGVWVHNEKGIERNAFKDTAYWNPSLRTDSSGNARVSFKLPDNLTTWTLAAVGNTSDTKVGQATTEIVVTKDIVIRPIIPNILRQGDEIILSALIQNFTESKHSFDVELKFDSGDVEKAKQLNVVLDSKEMKQIYWKVRPKIEREKSKLIFGMRARGDNKLADVVTQEIPVRAFGFEENRAMTGEGEKSFNVVLAKDSSKDKSTATLTLSPTIIGTLPTAMKYLVDYPYGCVEQTTSRFVPAVIALSNQDLFREALADKDVDDIIAKGISRLAMLQQSDGGWSWWTLGSSDPYITAYVLEYLVEAQRMGYEGASELVLRAQNYLTQDQYYDHKVQKYTTYTSSELAVKNYGLMVAGLKDKIAKAADLRYLSPDALSYAVMTNYATGNTSPETNGLNQLIGMAKKQGDALYWEGGNKINFGSTDASTALAIRAILFAGGDRSIAARGGQYLTRNRKSDYWSNTFATSQVIRALTDLSKTGNELSPNYTYSVLLDGKSIATGRVTNAKQAAIIVDVPISDIKPDGSKMQIKKNGSGQVYSTLSIKEFRTDRNAKQAGQGLTISREYINEKGQQYSLAVGDVAIVRLTVGGLQNEEYYGVISDQLPSGLVPINESFNNEQYGNSYERYYYSYDITDKEITENGIVMSLYRVAPGVRTYTYRARVVNEGKFIVPPATASLMYAPEIYGRSEAQTIEITKESKIIPGKIIDGAVKKRPNELVMGIVIGTLLIIGIIIRRKKISIQQMKDKLNSIVTHYRRSKGKDTTTQEE